MSAPDPAGASTAADFIQCLNDLRLWAGKPSLRRLRWLGGKVVTPHGDEVDALPASTTSYVLTGKGLPRLPRMAFVDAYVHACLEFGGRSADERLLLPRWRAAWRRVAQRGDHPGRSDQAPAQLPADLATFTGRAPELDHLLAFGTQAWDATAVVITAVDGMAGIGKTALAVHAAHQMADRFPDGQFFVDLHGFTAGVPPMEPADALDHMLRALGVPGEQIAAELDARAALYRTQMIDRRMLVLLDNAVTEAQVQPLLPGAPGCLVLITSRMRLAGLDDVHPLSLDILPLDDSLTLFTRISGGDHPSETVEEIVELCGRLPLAIRVAATRLRTRPSWSAAHLAKRLGELSELESGQRSVTAAIDLSYHHLELDERRLYRLLGLHPGLDIDIYGTAALIDGTLQLADRLLSGLYNAHLLEEPNPDRYQFHDLIRAHSATGEGSEPIRRAALTRLLDFYAHCASVAMNVLYPYELHSAPAIATPAPAFATPRHAALWLDTELTTLLAVAAYAADHGWPAHTVRLSATLHRHLRSRGDYTRALSLHAQGLRTARQLGDRAGEVDTLTGLGYAHRALGRYEAAADCYRQALAVARGIRHVPGEVHAVLGLGHLHRVRGHLDQALDHFEDALQAARGIGHRAGEVDALTGAAHIHRAQGRHGQAIEHVELALSVARDIGHRAGEVHALNALGHLQGALGESDLSAAHFHQALTIARDIGLRNGELYALTGLGIVHHKSGRHRDAATEFEQVLQIARGIGSRNYQFEALQGLADTDRAIGHAEDAITHHQAALNLALDLGQPEDQARAHYGLACANRDLGRHGHARTHWQHTLAILTDLDIPQIEEVTREEVRRNLASRRRPSRGQPAV